MEGEFKVGLARALENATTSSMAQACFQWFVREQWIHGKRHVWGDTPLFIVAGDPEKPGEAYVTIENLSDVCPVPVKCTPRCIDQGKQKTKPKLLKSCVQMLRSWCVTFNMVHDKPATAVAREEVQEPAERVEQGEEQSNNVQAGNKKKTSGKGAKRKQVCLSDSSDSSDEEMVNKAVDRDEEMSSSGSSDEERSSSSHRAMKR